MKTMTIYLPFCYPYSPYLAVAILTGQLKKYGYDAKSYDMNADYHSKIFSKEFLEKSLLKAKQILSSEEFKNISDVDINDFDSSLPVEKKIAILKKNIIKSSLENNAELINYTVEHIDEAVKIFKSEDFFDKYKFSKAQILVESAVEIALLPYSPCVSRTLKKPIFSENYDDIKYQVFNKDINPYYDYFEERIEQGKFDDINIVFLSCSHPSQLIPAFTLSNILKKKKKNIRICMGGNYITRIKDAFINNPEIFDIFIDALSISEGENSVVEYAEFVEGKRKIEDVSNLIWKNDEGQIVENPIKVYLDIKNRAIPSLDGIDFSNYLTPIRTFSMQVSKGCYWNKCTFCDYSYGKPIFRIYSVEKLIEELKYYKEKYDIKCFEFVDDALVVDFFDKVADRLIEENLGIYIYCYFRLENNLTKEKLEKFHKAGVVGIQWGYEATSERIMKMINKGIDVNNRLNILRRSAEVGIWNRVFGIAGFPSETEEEIISTIETFSNNQDIIHSFELFHYGLFKHSKMNKEKEKFGIKKIIESGEFSTINNFTKQRTPKKNIVKHQLALNKKVSNKFWVKCFPDEYLNIFLTRYNAKELANMEFDEILG